MDKETWTNVKLFAVIAILFTALAYDFGQKSIVTACKKVTFFYYGDQTFECLPYKKGMLEREVIPDLTPPR
jgi:hypothetical protein